MIAILTKMELQVSDPYLLFPPSRPIKDEDGRHSRRWWHGREAIVILPENEAMATAEALVRLHARPALIDPIDIPNDPQYLHGMFAQQLEIADWIYPGEKLSNAQLKQRAWIAGAGAHRHFTRRLDDALADGRLKRQVVARRIVYERPI